MTSIPCPHCGMANAIEARFCGACGLATTGDLIGRVIAGRYRMDAKLGEGGMGAVYRAEQISLKRTVAVKLLRPDVAGSPSLLRRFNAEAELVAKLSHPNTVNIYDFGQDSDGTLFIAMEFIEGRSLRSVVSSEAPLPPRRALQIALQVAASLADAHARAIVHRDLKPDNVMLQERGRQRDVVRVLDFGIAKLRDEGRATQMQMTQAGDMLGTPQYMAPEQIKGEPVDGRTDIYALGCMLYEMVTARLAYEGPTVMALLTKHLTETAVPPSRRRPELGIPPMIDDLVMVAMAKDIGQRPPTMDAYSERIAAVLAMLPPESHAPTAPPGTALPPMPTPAAWSAIGPAPPTPGQLASHVAPVTQTPPPRSSNAALWIVIATLALGGIAAGIYVATRSSSTPAAASDVATPGVDEPRPADEAADEADVGDGVDLSELKLPVSPPPQADTGTSIWDDDAPAAASLDTTHEIASGLTLSLPPGFIVTRPDGTFRADAANVAVMAAALPEVVTAADRAVLALYAQGEQLPVTFDQRMFAGARRLVATMVGTKHGIAIMQRALVLRVGRSRIVIALAVGGTDVTALDAAFAELSDRLVLPSGSKH